MASPGRKREGDDQEAVNRMFSPEFRNRLDAIVAFSHLPPEVVRQVVQKFVLQLEAQLAERAGQYRALGRCCRLAGAPGL